MTIASIIADRRDPLSIGKEGTVQEAAVIMAKNRIGFVLILNSNGSLAGIVSERDIVRSVSQGDSKLSSRNVMEIATVEIKTCSPEDDPHAVFDRMTQNKFRHMPVEQDGKILSVVSMTDLLRYFEQESSPAERAKAFEAFFDGSAIPGL